MGMSLEHLPLHLGLFALFLIITALFAFLETTLTAMRLFKLKELEYQSQKYKDLFITLEQHPQLILIATLIATNLASVASAVFAQNLIELLFEKVQLPGGLAFSLGIAFSSILITVFGEVIPKSIAKARGGNRFGSTLWIVNIVYKLLYPVSYVLNRIAHHFSGPDKEQLISEQEIQFLINYIDEHRLMDSEKTAMLQNVFRLGQITIADILIPLENVISISLDDNEQVLSHLFKKYQFSRFPVYKGTKTNIIGIVYQKDFFFALQDQKSVKVKDLVKPIIFVQKTLLVNELLKEFKYRQIHMAAVTNKHEEVIGVVTLEDALEEIVGDIQDEHETQPYNKKIKMLVPGCQWHLDPTLHLDKLIAIFNITFSVQHATTIGQFVQELEEQSETKKSKLFYKGYYFSLIHDSKKNPLVLVEKDLSCAIPPLK